MMFVLAGLPVVALTQLMGGIDPNLLLLCYGATLISILSLSAVSILASVIRRRTRDAIGMSYGIVLAYVILSFAPFILMSALSGTTYSFKFLRFRIYPFEVAELFALGNPLRQIIQYVQMQQSGGSSMDILLDLFRDYALFHFLVIVLCLSYSGWKLRAIALAELFGSVGRRRFWTRKRVRKAPNHPPVGNRPMLWKELYVQNSGRRTPRLVRLLALFFAMYTPPALFAYSMIYEEYIEFSSSAFMQDFSERIIRYCTILGMVITSVLYLRVAIRGAGCILGERDQHTLDELLTTELSTREILIAKWLGCLLGVRWHWIFLIAFWALGVACKAINVYQIPLLLLTTVIYAGFFAWLGILCSLYCRTTLRAILSSILGCLFWGGFGTYGLFTVLVVNDFMELLTAAGLETRDLLIDIGTSAIPPWTTAFLTVRNFDPNGHFARDFSKNPKLFELVVMYSMLVWIGLSLGFARIAHRRFARQANRLPYSPESVVAAFARTRAAQSQEKQLE